MSAEHPTVYCPDCGAKFEPWGKDMIRHPGNVECKYGSLNKQPNGYALNNVEAEFIAKCVKKAEGSNAPSK